MVEAVALKEEFARLSTSSEEMLEKLKTELQSEFNSVSEALKEGLGRCQDDPEGESGLKQLRAQVQTFAEDMKGFRDQVEKSGDVVKWCKSSTDEMNLQVKDLARRCEATSGTVGPVEVHHTRSFLLLINININIVSNTTHVYFIHIILYFFSYESGWLSQCTFLSILLYLGFQVKALFAKFHRK